MNAHRENSLNLTVLMALLAAWLGVWGAWIGNSAVALRINSFDMAEWATFLTEVRTGGLHFVPDLLRLSVVLSLIPLAISASEIRTIWLRWAVRVLAMIPALILMPPYPFVLQFWWSESYSLRFIVAALGIIGVMLSVLADRFVTGRRLLIVTLAAASLGLGAWSYLTLQNPFAIRYAEPIRPGWGLLLFMLGLLTTLIVEVVAVIRGSVVRKLNMTQAIE
jgi:hypothetical protein